VYSYAGFDAPALREILQSQLPTPEPTPAAPAAGPVTYESYVGLLFTTKCGACHGELATGGLNLTTYASAMQGSAKGPVMLAGNSAGSKLVEVQSTGKHFANLSAEELELLKQWIDGGALEK
jgi:mono/diheme cytochrome c family protein